MAKNVDNQNKVIAGLDNNAKIKNQLQQLKVEGIIKDYNCKVNFAHKEFKYDKQFLANFVIETVDEKFIIIRTSTSFRHDRAKIGFYDFEGILNHSSFAEEIIATIYLVPDSELGNNDFINTREKVKEKDYYCPATHLLSLSEFISFLEGYKYDLLSKQEEALHESHSTELLISESGSFYGKKGNNYELEIVNILSNLDNLLALKSLGRSSINVFDLIVNKISSDLNIDKGTITQIKASNSVPLLLSGGNPKTDIILTIEVIGGKSFKETISVKNTTQSRVTCHDYPSKDFIRVLNCGDTRLANYFNYFQQEPVIKAFKESMSDGYTVEEFTALLEEKEHIFSRWVLTGEFDFHNLTVPEVQISKYLLLNKNEQLAFYTMDEYLAIISKKSSKTFGMPFGWTYPSKQRGKRIQLKVPVLLDIE